MKMTKRLAALAMSCALSMGLVACSAPATTEPATPEASKPATTAPATPEASKPAFPTKSVELLVPFAAGGGTDAAARALASATEKYLGQPIVIVNKTGGSGAVGLTEGATAKNDGYKIAMITRELVTLPLNELCAVTAEDYELICNVNVDPGLITVAADSPLQTLDDLIAAAKAAPDSLKFASTATPNMYAYTLQLDQDISFNHVPFNGAAEAIPAVLGGHADFTIASPGEVLSQVQGGQLRALAIMSEDRISALPDVPTCKESGVDIATGTWRGLGAPDGTPDEVLDVLKDAFAQGVQDPDFVEFMEGAALNIHYQTADDFATFIEDDTAVASAIFDSLK